MSITPILSLLSLLGLVILAGCTAVPTLIGGAGGADALGTAQVTLAAWGRSTQATAEDVSTVSISVSPKGGNPFFGRTLMVPSASFSAGTATARFSGLSVGTWQVSAKALGAAGQNLGSATADVAVTSGQTSQVTLPIKLAPTSGLQLQVGLREKVVRWNAAMPAASESAATELAFLQTAGLENDGNRWEYVLKNDAGTHAAVYTVAFDGLTGNNYLRVEVAGRAPHRVKLSDGGASAQEAQQNDLYYLPGTARLVATGSESVAGQSRPFRKFRFSVDYPYTDGRTVAVQVERWVAPDVGSYREAVTESFPDGELATSSLELVTYAF